MIVLNGRVNVGGTPPDIVNHPRQPAIADVRLRRAGHADGERRRLQACLRENGRYDVHGPLRSSAGTATILCYALRPAQDGGERLGEASWRSSRTFWRPSATRRS